MYAVIETGGKQVRVRVGDVVDVERVGAEPGSPVVFDRVLLVRDGDGDSGDARVGTPTVEGARVKGTVLADVRDKKVLSYIFKRRQNSNRRIQGHRQHRSRVQIDAIEI